MDKLEEIEKKLQSKIVSEGELWFVVTIRVAWELHFFGYDVESELLDEARKHVLLSLPKEVNLPQVDRLALIYTHEYIDRYQYDRYAALELDEDIFSTIPFDFRQELISKFSKNEKVLFHFHYCDRYPINVVSKNSSIPLEKLEKARRRLIHHTRKILEDFITANSKEHVSSEIENTYFSYNRETWEINRIERLISRIANLVPSDYGLEDFDSYTLVKENLTSEQRRKMKSCPRRSRIFRLLKKGDLKLEDLHTETAQMSVSEIKQTQEKVLVLLLHPDIQDDVDEFLFYMSKHAIQTNSEAWYIPSSKLPKIQEILHICAEKGSPSRHQVRGAMYTGCGMWGNDILLGPMALRALDSVRLRAWGEIDGIDTLPAPIPPPSNPVLWWGGTFSSLGIGLASLVWIFSLQTRNITYPMDLNFKVSTDQVWARFEVDDLSYVSIIKFQDGIFEVVDSNLQDKKGTYATGEGRFFIHERADNLIIVSHSQKIEDWQSWLSLTQNDTEPLNSIHTIILDTHPDADVRVSPTYSPHVSTKIQDIWNSMTQNL